MDIRQITDHYFVSPQIDPEDVATLRESGFAAIICNRPDGEVPPSHRASAMRAAAEAANIDFHELPLTHQTMTADNIAAQKALADSAGGPVLAYCASGTRSSVVWALGQAGNMSADDILARTSAAGYQLDALRPSLGAAG